MRIVQFEVKRLQRGVVQTNGIILLYIVVFVVGIVAEVVVAGSQHKMFNKFVATGNVETACIYVTRFSRNIFGTRKCLVGLIGNSTAVALQRHVEIGCLSHIFVK